MGIGLLALAAAAQAVPPAPTLAEAAASLDGKPQCVAFKWLDDGKGTARAAISVPVAINDRMMQLQLDTGSDVTVLYGHAADRAGWAAAGQQNFRAATLAIGATTVDRPMIYVAPDMEEDPALAGTIGLPELAGRIAVIDYPHQRFCLFAEADLPAALASARYASAILRNAKLFVPIRLDAYASDAFVFDTGSSALPLTVDLTTWKALTGKDAVGEATVSYKGSSWGKPVVFSGAQAQGAVTLGKLELGRPIVFTNAAEPRAFATWPFRAEGTLGNASLWDGIVIIDLTARIRFGYLR